MNRPDRHHSDLDRLLSELEPPDDRVRRVVAGSLGDAGPRFAAASAWRRRILLSAALVLVLASSVWLTISLTPTEPATETPLPADSRADYRLSNRDGLLVLESRNGRYLAISGESELQPMAGVN